MLGLSASVFLALVELSMYLLGEGGIGSSWQERRSLVSGLCFSEAVFLAMFLVAASIVLLLWRLRDDRSPIVALERVAVFYVTFSCLNLLKSGNIVFPRTGSARLETGLFLLFATLAAAGYWRRSEERSRSMSSPWTIVSLLSILALGGVGLVAWLTGFRAVSVAAVLLLSTLAFSLSAYKEAGRRFSTACGPLLFLSLLALSVFLPPGRTATTQGQDRAGVRAPVEVRGPRTVLLITIDTLRADTLEKYGGPPKLAPHLNSLANESVVFAQAVSPAPWTLPALSSIMTGLAPASHTASTRYSTLPTGLRTLAEYLSASGYRTLAIGKNPYLMRGLDQGFSETHLFPEPRWNSFGLRQARKLWPSLQLRGTTDELTGLAVGMLEKYSKDPLFLWVHYFDPHLPYEPPAEYVVTREASSAVGSTFNRLLDVRRGVYVPSLSERAKIRDLYHGEVKYVDDNVGKLLAALKRTGRYSDALIVVTSDHGEEFWDHGNFEHGHTLFEELLRVPLLIRSSSGVARVVPHRVSTESVFATVLDELQLDFDAPVPPARSLHGFLRATGEPAEEALFSTGLLYYEDQIAVTWKGFKFVKSLVSDYEALYDLNHDPGERASVASADQVIDEGRALIRTFLSAAEGERRALNLDEINIDAMSPAEKEQLQALGYL